MLGQGSGEAEAESREGKSVGLPGAEADLRADEGIGAEGGLGLAHGWKQVLSI